MKTTVSDGDRGDVAARATACTLRQRNGFSIHRYLTQGYDK